MAKKTQQAGPTLTVQELEAAHLARFDLGPGYPQLPVPEYVTRIYLDDRIEAMSLQTAPAWTPASQASMDKELDSAVRAFIGLPTPAGRDKPPYLRTTFTGSTALDRVVSSVKRFARAAKAPEIDVVTTTPSIDIMRLFLEEHAEITPHFVESRKRNRMGALDVDKLRAALRAAKADRRTLVCLLTSPENPTGEHWPEVELRSIAEDCVELGAILIVDHTFAVSGVQTETIPKIWDLAPSGLRWLATWDTGKTFGLNEDKLGFIIAGDRGLADFVDEALAVMQFGVARRQKLFFTQVIQEAIDSDYLGELRTVCRKNLAVLVKGLRGTSIKVRKPSAGSMALLDFSATGYTDEEVRQALLRENVGVISGNVFFHGDWVPRSYVRVALARPAEHFADAVELIAKRFAVSAE